MNLAPHRFTDFPERLDASLYDEAVERFARAVRSRALAVYRDGRVRFPGLSDIDLLVVVDDRPVWDNDAFFSPFVRLPRRYHALFHHRPHFVTRSTIDAIGYSTFAYVSRRDRDGRGRAAADGGASFCRQLIAGDDVVPSSWPELSDSWYACTLFETAIAARQRFEHFRQAPLASVGRLASMAASLRFPLRQLDELRGTDYERAYTAIVDRSRAELLDPGGERESAAAVLYTLYAATLAGFERSIGELAGAERGQDPLEAARDILAGRRRVEAVDAAFLRSRHAAITGYFKALSAARISGLTIFVREPYRREVALFRQQPWVGRAATALRAVGDAIALR